MNRMLTKIDKCCYCDKKAEYLYIRKGIITTKIREVCNDHRKEIEWD